MWHVRESIYISLKHQNCVYCPSVYNTQQQMSADVACSLLCSVLLLFCVWEKATNRATSTPSPPLFTCLCLINNVLTISRSWYDDPQYGYTAHAATAQAQPITRWQTSREGWGAWYSHRQVHRTGERGLWWSESDIGNRKVAAFRCILMA